MRRKFLMLLSGLALLSAASLRADLTFILTPSVRLGDGTNAVIFTGTLSNTSPTDNLFLNDLQISFTNAATYYLTADTNAFFANVPGILLPGETYSDVVFAIAMAPATPPGDYYGTVTLQGGADIFATNNLANQTFAVPTVAGLVANSATYHRVAGTSLKLLISDLLTNATDVADETVVWAGLGLVTTNGANLITNDSYIFYTNSVSLNVADRFTYTISDNVGRTATGAVQIILTSASSQLTASVAVNGSNVNLKFFGIPDFQYQVQRGTNAMSTINWVTIKTTNAPSGGRFIFADDFSDLGGVGNAPAAAFYRLVAP